MDPPAPRPDPPPQHPMMELCTRLVPAAIALVLLAHALQAISPLRLNFDSVLLLEMVENFRSGRGWNPELRSQHPIGYPAILVALDTLSLARPWAMVLVNLGALTAGLWAIDRVLARAFPQLPGGRPTRLLILLLTALSWVTIKHSPLVVTDAVYLGISSLALLALTRAWAPDPLPQTHRLALLVLGVALTIASLLTRTIGIALLPAILWAALGQPERVQHLVSILRARKGLLVALLAMTAIAMAALVFVMTRTTYWLGFVKQYQGASVAQVILDTAGFRLIDLGQVVLNIPAATVPQRLQPVLYVAGFIGYALLLSGLWKSRARLSPAHFYFLAYSAIVLIWPFADPRFWLPILPLAAALVIQALAPLWRTRHGPAIAAVYLHIFNFLGVIALAFSTRISLSGDRFPDLFGSGTYSDSYRAAFNQPHDPAKVYPDVLRLLQRYEPRAAPRK